MRQDSPGCVDYYPGWLEDADRLFAVLQDQIAWEQHELTLYGRTIPTPRLTAWMGDTPYRYSGIVNEPTPWPTTATTSPNWVRDRLLPRSASAIGGGLCCGIGPPVSDGVGT